VTESVGPPDLQPSADWIGWRCSYCGEALAPHGEGLLCAEEQRWFGTDEGVHRLLPAARRRELQPFLELYQRVRRDEGWRAEPGLPEVAPSDPHAAIWRARASRFQQALALCGAALSRSRWDVLEVGAGCAWASARLSALGHRVAAVDVNLDPDDGLRAAARIAPPGATVARAEAEMDALPVDAGSVDVVLAAGALHYTRDLARTLVELRRVTRKGGLLVVLDSPVYRRRPDGESMVAGRMKAHEERYGFPIPRETQSSYLVVGELRGAFASSGWNLEMHGWPGPVREGLRDVVEIARHGRRTARFPILLGRRDG
jgi:SAM-dependent methyltransferase